jgi:hypothetical protein
MRAGLSSILLACLWAVLLAASAGAAQQELVLEPRVTSVAGIAVHLDLGEADGVRVGDRVRFALAGATAASGRVQSISQNGARVELDPGSPVPPPGTRGELRVPRERLAAGGAQAPTAPGAPVVWSQPAQEWEEGRPLLAPAFGRAPEDRPRSLWGRAWVRYDTSSDAENDARYGLGAVGADLALDNAFGLADTLRVAGELYSRTSDVEGGQYEYDESRARLDRLSWTLGDQAERTHRIEVGRFLQREFPELGVLDGAEWRLRAGSASAFGASLGWMPDAFDLEQDLDDLQAAVFGRFAFDERGRHTLAAAYQSTWHDGEADRNLFVVRAESLASETLALRAVAWIDLYTSDDVIKGSGTELTEAQLSATWSAAEGGGGLGLFALHRAYPELLRAEYAGLSPQTVQDGELDRIALTGWTPLGKSARLDGRAELWSDESDEGVTGEAGLTLREVLGEASQLTLAGQWVEGGATSGPGARLALGKTFGTTAATLGWQSYWYEQDTLEFSSTDLAQHTLYGTLDLPIGRSWTLSLLGDRTIGDSLDAWSAGILLQVRL